MIVQRMSDGTFRRKITDKEIIYNETPKITIRVEKKKFKAGQDSYEVFINNEILEAFPYPTGDEKKGTVAKNKALKEAKSLKAKISAKNIISKLR